MSTRWPGGIISQTAPVPSGPYQNSTAPGVWTLEQQAYWARLGQWPTAGNTDPSAFIENLFSTYLYTGNGSTQTITNGVNLSGQGGLVWIKKRSAPDNHVAFDTARGNTKQLIPNLTNAETTDANAVTSFNSNGFSLGSGGSGFTNQNGDTYASWTFRKQPKFFDVVTYTGDGTASRNISHSLDSTPGMIIVKKTNSATNSDWWTWHRSISTGNLSANNLLRLNLTNAQLNVGTVIGTANSTSFQVGDDTSVNASGSTYVAYVFAHNAGGFGLTGTDNVISCGSFTTDANGDATVNLGYEPQYILYKRSSSTGSWYIFDNMRGMANQGSTAATPTLFANVSNAEAANAAAFFATATGFQMYNQEVSSTLIYMAIRRGPMKTPTSGTSVFSPILWSGSSSQTLTPGFPTDLVLQNNDIDLTFPSGFYWGSRLQGNDKYLQSASTAAEGTFSSWDFSTATGTFVQSLYSGTVGRSINYFMRRAPGFFDVVCYQSNSSFAASFTHNLGVTPELIIFKNRQTGGGSGDWLVYSLPTGNNKNLLLNASSAETTQTGFIQTLNSTTVITGSVLAQANQNYVSYLFATVAGVSKVGSYTGTGTTQIVNCGFTGGARFVLIKRTDSTGDWYVWDSARGIVAGNDPYLLLNSTAAEVTNTDYVDTASSGFEISSTAPAAINANGGTFIFLAIA